MHEKRNFIVVLLLIVSVVWAIVAWFLLPDQAPMRLAQRVASPALIVVLGGWLVYALRYEDKLPDHLGGILGGGIYYEADGLSFMPTVRINENQAELSVYYQNRFENPVEAVVHLRPSEDSFVIRPGMRDVHFAFKASGGDFGVIHQPIAVPRHLQGEVINVQLAASTFYPRSHGSRVRKQAGIPCGSLLVDWGGAAFRIGVHEVSGEIELVNPATLHLSMPTNVAAALDMGDEWKQEQLVAGVSA